MTKEDYKNYLRFIYTQKNGEKLSAKSINHYADESLRFIDKNMPRITREKYSSIFEINSLSELLSVQEAFLADDEFMEVNIKGHNMYTAGFNRYIDFARGTEFKGKRDKITLLDTPTLPEYSGQHTSSISTKRDKIKVLQLAEACSYHCEINPMHKTFIAESTGKPYFGFFTES